jgi:hypothetical protein
MKARCVVFISVASFFLFLSPISWQITSKAVHSETRVFPPEVVNTSGVSAFIETHLSKNQIQVSPHGDIYVAFTGLAENERETQIFFRKKDTKTNKWGEQAQISENEMNRGASLWVSPAGDIHLVWTIHEIQSGRIGICYRNSKDGGRNWSKIRLFEAGNSVARYPTVIGDKSGNLYIYTINGPLGETEKLLIFQSNDNGASWRSVDVNFGEERRGSPAEARLAISGAGKACLLWLDPTPGGRAVVFSKTADGGRNWSQPVPLNDDLRLVLSAPQIVAQQDTLYVVWVENRGEESILYFDYSEDGGETWNLDQIVYQKLVRFITPKLLEISENKMLAWTDYREQIGEKGERLLYNLFSRNKGWFQTDPGAMLEVGPAANLKRFLGFDMTSALRNGVAVAFSEKRLEKRAQVFCALSNDLSFGFATALPVSNPKRGIDAVSPRICQISENELAVLYNEVPAQLYMGQPIKWLGDLVLTRIHARLELGSSD